MICYGATYREGRTTCACCGRTPNPGRKRGRASFLAESRRMKRAARRQGKAEAREG